MQQIKVESIFQLPKDYVLITKVEYEKLMLKRNDLEIINEKNQQVELLNVSEVSKILKVNKNKVYELVRTGHLKALKIGSLKVSSEEVERFIRENTGKDLSNVYEVRELIFEE